MKVTRFDQFVLETRSVIEGVRRYRRAMKRRSAETPPGFMFLRRHLKPLAKAIAVDQTTLTPGPGRPSLREEVFKALSAEQLALITLRTALTAVCTRGSDATITGIAKQIGELCRLEVHYQEQKKTTPQWQARRTDRKYQRTSDKQPGQGDHDVEDVNVGAWLIWLALNSTTAFIRGHRPAPLGRPDYERAAILKLRLETELWLETAHHEVEGLTPVDLPMIVVPANWEDLSGGGYLTNRSTGNLPLVKRLGKTGAQELRAANLTQVYRAVNALQQTAWAVNAEIYALMRQAWDQSLDVGNLPIRPTDDPPRPLPGESDEKAKQSHRVAWARWYRKRDALIGARTMLKMRLKYCRILKKYPRLYLPYQLDTRGRAYPVPQIFHPQADDAGRALIKFARGKPLTEHGRYWLAIYLATLYGNDWDKKPFDERIAWVDQHEKEIRDSVERPFNGDRFWNGAEKPWHFLAACHEWARPRKYRGVFMSHLPVVIDGTCNGLQHLSALSRDPEGARATNVIPSPMPQDVYERVAGLLRSRLQEKALAGDPMAEAWRPRVNRKLVKKATLATPYGITDFGIQRGLTREDLTEGFEDEWKAAEYLFPHIKSAIEAAAPGSKLILDWLMKIAGDLKEQKLPVIWTTPAGFRVVHQYEEQAVRTVKAGGFSLQLRVEAEEVFERRHTGRQLTAIGANFVHSLDAAHMMLTINRLLDQDEARFQDFAMVHDGYGVHACDVDELNRALREEFVRIHARPLLEQFVDEQRTRTGVELQDPEKLGSGFDLTEVLQSEYFFS